LKKNMRIILNHCLIYNHERFYKFVPSIAFTELFEKFPETNTRGTPGGTPSNTN